MPSPKAEILPQNDMVSSIVRKVVSESAKSKVSDGSMHSMDFFDSHIARMRGIFGSNYEFLCLDKLIARSKSMSRWELERFATRIEQIAIGSKVQLAEELRLPLVIGIIEKSHTPKDIDVYYNLILKDLNGRCSRLDRLAGRESRGIERIRFMLSRDERSILRRIFRKGKITLGRKRLGKKSTRLGEIDRQKNVYKDLMQEIEGLERARALAYQRQNVR